MKGLLCPSVRSAHGVQSCGKLPCTTPLCNRCPSKRLLPIHAAAASHAMLRGDILTVQTCGSGLADTGACAHTALAELAEYLNNSMDAAWCEILQEFSNYDKHKPTYPDILTSPRARPDLFRL